MKPGAIGMNGSSCRVSFSQAVPVHLRGKVREISSLVTDQASRGHGSASELMREVIQQADQDGMALLVVVVPFDGEPLDSSALQQWYSRLGFIEIQPEPCVMVRMPIGH